MGKKLVFVPECHSTNDLAMEFIRQSTFPEGTVVVTGHQTAGRGQRGNTWVSAPGKNLTLSVILKPVFLPVQHQFFLNIFTSLAVGAVVDARTGEQSKIKWPNDIIVAGKKVCGILIENQIKGQQVSSAVIGIGLNVNQNDFGDIPATSVFAHTGIELDLADVLNELLAALESRYLQLRRLDFDTLRTEYLNNLYRRGETHRFSANDVSFAGTITGIDEAGRLVLDTPSGLRTFGVKELKYLD